MSRELDELAAQVARAKTVSTSAITLIQGLATRIEELKLDPAALQALADELRAGSDSLADAIEAVPPPTP